jgi:cellulose synthase/poly-beta-1,6-N-acetylglucosamine synthase-like glycosyltransferase
MISAVGVVVPARDERRRIGRCVRALLVALRALPPWLDASVCVVADRCRDDTARLAGAVLGSGRVVANHADRTIGEVRDLGCRHVLTMLGRHEPAEVLLLCTDADSVVAPDWASQHVRMIDSGAHATAGTVELAGRPALPPVVAERYTAVVADAGGPDGHGNVYGANLAVRADAYLAVGGFGAVASGEDRALWRRLGDGGYRRRYVVEPVVRTSARRHGRAPGGLADLLRNLHDGVASTEQAREGRCAEDEPCYSSAPPAVSDVDSTPGGGPRPK